MLAAAARGASTEQVLYSFQGGTDGTYPAGGVVFDQSGDLYGATSEGGASSCSPQAQCGTVFELTPGSGGWTETQLYVFKGKAYNDGDAPSSGLILDQAGNLYGVTAYGGSGNCVLSGTKGGCGTVYELTPNGSTWTETILYSFQGDKDGYFPAGNLVFDAAGNLYGATNFGGGYGDCNPIYGYCGTIFKLSPPSGNGGPWTETVLYRFKGGKDGAYPNGGLIFDNQGNLYGTTEFGGGSSACTWEEDGCGTVFELKPPTKKGGAWTESLLHRFKGYPDGHYPNGGLIFDKKGGLYGTTVSGGEGSSASGTAFQLKPPRRKGGAWAETILYTFTGGNDGGNPMAGLIFDEQGNLYGTDLGGASYGGNVYELSPAAGGGAWTLTVLYNFTGPPNGYYPAASLIFGQAGSLFGTTQWGGNGQGCQYGGCGTAFEVTP
jgi:hypothetical protein